jgi:hypothetical protein
MATRSTISMREVDNTVKTIYSHWDGYPSHNGKLLLEHYTDLNKIRELINLGDISVLDEHLHPTDEGYIRTFVGNDYVRIRTDKPHSFEQRWDGVCLFYKRDRKDKEYDNVEPYRTYKKFPNEGEEYDYMFDIKQNKWLVRNNRHKKPVFRTLTTQMCEKD